MSRDSPALRAPRALVVPPGEAGRRLDVWLAEALGASRAEVRRVLSAGRVAIGGAPVGLRAKGRALAPGERIEVAAWTPPGDRTAVPEPDAPLAVLAEGPGWVAVDKPAGRPVHPLAEGETGTVLNALVARHPEVLGVGEGALRSGVVHRLDVDTSGVLVFATDPGRFEQLRSAFRRHRVTKRYRAIVAGRPPYEGDVTLHLAVGRHRPARVRVVDEDDPAPGRSRRTRLGWRVLAALEDASLVEVRLETGFLHQIRATMAHLGHPVLGDAVYGTDATASAARRQMLHAAHVAWRDVEAHAPDPEDLAALRARLSPPT